VARQDEASKAAYAITWSTTVSAERNDGMRNYGINYDTGLTADGDCTRKRFDDAVVQRELKAERAGELQVHGSGALIRWLLENDLVDEMTLLIVPVVLGQGTRLFPADGPDMALDLVESRADSKGVTIQVYRPAGRPRYPAG
jgi:dihydrofolate reductase